MTLPGSRRSAWAGAVAALAIWTTASAAVPARAQVCAGDCSGDGEVRVGDIVLAVNIVLGLAPVDACPSLGTPPIGIAQVIASIANALCACQPCPTPPPAATATATSPPTRTPTATPTPTPVESHWTENALKVPSSNCPSAVVAQLRKQLAGFTARYTVRGRGGAVTLIDDAIGQPVPATLDDEQVLRATLADTESQGGCTITVTLALSVDLSRSPTTASYDGRVTTQSCPRSLNCRLTVASRWTRTSPAAIAGASPGAASSVRVALRRVGW